MLRRREIREDCHRETVLLPSVSFDTSELEPRGSLPNPSYQSRHRHRFKTYTFLAGTCFAEAACGRMALIWQQEAGHDVDLPHGWQNCGWDGDEFSLRRGLDTLQDHLALLLQGVLV